MIGPLTRVFITGGTGYIGRRLIPVLQRQGCSVRALVRPGSERKVPPGCEVVVGNPLDRATFEQDIEPESAFVQLLGVRHPLPRKAQQFYDIDLVSAKASIDAATARQVDHFVYVSVAQPAPIMKAYQLSRAIAEGHLAQSGLTSSVLRPWYVLGPGHRWPIVLTPFYWIAERRASSRAAALRLGLVTIDQMVAALALVVAAPPKTSRILTVPDIRRASL
ncbi:MAG: NAD(P)H-binding protein [Vicinamibacteraceae bacterium]